MAAKGNTKIEMFIHFWFSLSHCLDVKWKFSCFISHTAMLVGLLWSHSVITRTCMEENYFSKWGPHICSQDWTLVSRWFLKQDQGSYLLLRVKHKGFWGYPARGEDATDFPWKSIVCANAYLAKYMSQIPSWRQILLGLLNFPDSARNLSPPS